MKRKKKKKRTSKLWMPMKILMKRIIIMDGAPPGKGIGTERGTAIDITETETMIGTGTMGEDVKEIEIGIENAIEIEIEIEIGKGTETAIGQEMRKIMVEKGSEKGTGKVESGREETETVDGVGAVQGAGVEIAETETVKMVITARGVLVAAQVLEGGPKRMVVPGKSPRRRKKRRRKRAMEPITQIQRLLRLTGFVLRLGWHL